MLHKKVYFWIGSIALGTTVLFLAITAPPLPNSVGSSKLLNIKWDSAKPSYARCTHHVGLNPSSFALKTSARWQTAEPYEQIRQRFLERHAYDPNLARQDPAWSDYDLLSRRPTTIKVLGIEVMNASTLNYNYFNRTDLQVVTSRTIVICSNSRLIKMASNRMQPFLTPYLLED